MGREGESERGEVSLGVTKCKTVAERSVVGGRRSENVVLQSKENQGMQTLTVQRVAK